jgi:hypothetical protein
MLWQDDLLQLEQELQLTKPAAAKCTAALILLFPLLRLP